MAHTVQAMVAGRAVLRQWPGLAANVPSMQYSGGQTALSAGHDGLRTIKSTAEQFEGPRRPENLV